MKELPFALRRELIILLVRPQPRTTPQKSASSGRRQVEQGEQGWFGLADPAGNEFCVPISPCADAGHPFSAVSRRRGVDRTVNSSIHRDHNPVVGTGRLKISDL
jgi:hypothetical protein